MFEDTKGLFRSRKSKHNDQERKDKRTDNDLQNTTKTIKDRVA
jgi:hypothetical protein